MVTQQTTSESGRSSLMQSLAKNAAGCASAQQVECPDLGQRWELLIEQWQPMCETTAARRGRRAWRRRALELVAESRGVPTELRRKVWCTVLEAAVEADAPNASQQFVHLSPRAHHDPIKNEEESLPSPKLAVIRRRDEPRWARPRRADDGRISPRLVPREIALDVPRTFGVTRETTGTNEDASSLYQKTLSTTSTSSANTIEKNTARFVEETRLRRLLTHFARTSPGVQYFQGMNFLGGTLLRVFDNILPEAVVDDTQPITNLEKENKKNQFIPQESTGNQSDDSSITSASRRISIDDNDIVMNSDDHTMKHEYIVGATRHAGLKKKHKKAYRRSRSQPPLSSHSNLRSSHRAERITTTIDAATATAFKGLMALVTPLYVPDFLGLRELVDVATSLLPKVAPKLSTVLAQEGLDLMPVLAPWCLTLFSSTAMDFECVLICWDFLILGTPSRREELLLGSGLDDTEPVTSVTTLTSTNIDNIPNNTPFVLSSGADENEAHNQDDTAFSETSSDAASANHNPASASKPRMTGIFAAVRRNRPRRRSKALFSLSGTLQTDDETDHNNYSSANDNEPPPPPQGVIYSTPPAQNHQNKVSAPTPTTASSFVQTLQSKRHRNKVLSSTTERHGVLLRLCLVMLKLGEEATWQADESGDAKDMDDLHALSKLLEAAQPSPVCDAEVAPDTAKAIESKRASSGYCFPADPAVLCTLFAKTKVDAKLVRSFAKRFRKEYEDSHPPPVSNNEQHHEQHGVDSKEQYDSPRPTEVSFNDENVTTDNSNAVESQQERRSSFVWRFFLTLRYPITAYKRRRKALFTKTESASFGSNTVVSRPSTESRRYTV